MEHANIPSEECHEPKHITNTTTSDAGKVITPSSSTDGTSVLRRLLANELAEGADVALYTGILANDVISPQGWAKYVDGLSTATQTITTTFAKLAVDSLGTNIIDHLPKYYADTSSNLYVGATGKVNVAFDGDIYEFEIELTVSSASGGPHRIELAVDAGSSSGSVTNRIATVNNSVDSGTGIIIPLRGKFFATADAVTNGVQFFVKTNSGSVTVGARSIYIHRVFRGTA